MLLLYLIRINILTISPYLRKMLESIKEDTISNEPETLINSQQRYKITQPQSRAKYHSLLKISANRKRR